MGQKVNPVGFRILTNNKWNSIWYNEDDYADNFIKDIKIRDYILKKYKDASISKVFIERTSDMVTIIIYTSKSGVLIGKKGVELDKIKSQVKKFGDKNVNIKVFDVEKPDTDAQIVANNIAKQIENRAPYRRVIKKVIQTSMRHNIKGIKIKIGGRLNGVEIARAEIYKEGSVPLHTLKSDIDYATCAAYTIYGLVGIKVWIYKK